MYLLENCCLSLPFLKGKINFVTLTLGNAEGLSCNLEGLFKKENPIPRY